MNPKPTLVVDGMYGIGDNLHQRALLRELMKTHDVWLKSCHFTLYHDLVEQGLKVLFKDTRLRAQARTVNQERHLFHHGQPPDATHQKIWYNKPDIDKHGSILESIMGELPHKTEKPDFSLPIHPSWAQAADDLLRRLRPDRPILILRQLVLRKEWDGSKRNPDPKTYKEIYHTIRPFFWTLSIADLAHGQEWIEGPTLHAEANIHDGSLTFGTMAALYARAALVLSPAGHGPILAHATGTPVIAVYGGRESFRTTDRAGAHLSPTLGIDPDQPCDCHSNAHNCNKHITLEPALERVRAFLASLNLDQPMTPNRHLIFATTYVDCPERQHLTSLWLKLHSTLNPDADLLIVDAKSPTPILPEAELVTFVPYVPGKTAKRTLHTFAENVGHLSRGGRDGWGRAFCFGLDAAIDGRYDYVAHIEGDLLFRVPLAPVFAEMFRTRTKAVTTPVKGTNREVPGWAETALMLFEVNHLIESNLTERYHWQHRRPQPTPEVVVRELLGHALANGPWKVLRGDKNQITHQNVVAMDLDGVTHCHRDVWVYDRFTEAALARHQATQKTQNPPPPQYPAPRKLNLGCGQNQLPGWENHDTNIDIRKPLPWANETIDLVMAEHLMEHVSYHQAIRFMEEVRRILKPGGTLRLTVPSLEQVLACEDPDYHKFTAQWGGEASSRGAARAIIFAHGHEQAWTLSLLQASLTYAGFIHLTQHTPGQSQNPLLRGVEGHGKVIGDEFNRIESLTMEAIKPGGTVVQLPTKPRAALILGGAESHQQDLETALQLLRQAGREATIFMVNDQIAEYPGPGVACTLHPAKLADWLSRRRNKGLVPPTQTWGHRRETKEVTNTTQDWAGSSGLFATKVALMELNFDRVILCGVPMTIEGRHFKRRQEWGACVPFRRGWHHNLHHLTGKVKSTSGWTAQLLGEPTPEWLGVESEGARKTA